MLSYTERIAKRVTARAVGTASGNYLSVRFGKVVGSRSSISVSIADAGQQLAAQSERHVEIVYTGLRPGEKLHKVLRDDDECERRQGHELICQVDVPTSAPELVHELRTKRDRESLIVELNETCEMNPSARARQEGRSSTDGEEVSIRLWDNGRGLTRPFAISLGDSLGESTTPLRSTRS